MTTSDRQSDSNDHVKLVDYSPGLDQSYVDVLQRCFDARWGNVDQWRNKHLQRPGFEPCDAKQFQVNGMPASCFHTAFASFALEPDLFVPVSLEGDYAVAPEFRRKGMVEKAHEITGKEMYERGAVLRCGFTSGDIHARVYSKKFCHVFVPTVTTTYRKLLSSSQLTGKLLAYVDSLRKHRLVLRLIRKKPLTIALRIPGYDQSVISLALQGATLSQQLSECADISISIPYRVLAAKALGFRAMLPILIKCVVTRELRIKGLTSSLRRLL